MSDPLVVLVLAILSAPRNGVVARPPLAAGAQQTTGKYHGSQLLSLRPRSQRQLRAGRSSSAIREEVPKAETSPAALNQMLDASSLQCKRQLPASLGSSGGPHISRGFHPRRLSSMLGPLLRRWRRRTSPMSLLQRRRRRIGRLAPRLSRRPPPGSRRLDPRLSRRLHRPWQRRHPLRQRSKLRRQLCQPLFSKFAGLRRSQLAMQSRQMPRGKMNMVQACL